LLLLKIGFACITHNVRNVVKDYSEYFPKNCLALVFFLQECEKVRKTFLTDFVLPLNKACDSAWNSIWGIRGIRPFECLGEGRPMDTAIVYATNIFERENKRTNGCKTLLNEAFNEDNGNDQFLHRLTSTVLKVRDEPTFAFDIPFSELWVISYHGKKDSEARMSDQLIRLLEVVFKGVKKYGIPALIGADFNIRVKNVNECLEKVFFHFLSLIFTLGLFK
jgi:hypothetical protein